MRIFIVIFVLFIATISCKRNEVSGSYASDRELVEKIIDQEYFALNQLNDIDEGRTRIFPRSLDADGEMIRVGKKDWTSGFYPGILWMMYEMTSDSLWKDEAVKYTELLKDEQYNSSNHDIGFKMMSSYGQAYKLTGNKAYREILIQSARTLITRFNENVGCIRSWDHHKDQWDYPVIIDNMINLELLFWASKETGDPVFANIAIKHAQTTMLNHFRPDYSTYHVVSYDTLTGKAVKKQTRQGASDESSWARGQAWALYGYTMAYRETHIPDFLTQAENIANYILNVAKLPDDYVPYWDFSVSSLPDEPRDVSAAAVIAAALIELSSYSVENSENYLQTANSIMNSLESDKYFNNMGSKGGFLLRHSTGSKPVNSEVDVPLVYADYYFWRHYLDKIIYRQRIYYLKIKINYYEKTLLISKLMLLFMLFTAWNVSAQEVYFVETFNGGSAPDGWSSDNVAYISSSSIPNQTEGGGANGAKMKASDPVSSWLQMPEVNGVTDLVFWCKSNNTSNNLDVKIQSSTDGTTWTDVVATIPGLDHSITDFQNITVPINIEGNVTIRFYVYTTDGASTTAAFYVDDIQLGKPAAAANDASIFTLSVDGMSIAGFSPDVTSYTDTISHAVDYTAITVETNDPNATVVITQVTDISGTEAERTASIVVTSVDQSVTTTTKIVFTQADYWYKTGFPEEGGLEGWETSRTFFDVTPNYPSSDKYPGVANLKFTGGHETGGTNPAHGYLLSPKLINVGTFSFWVSAETVLPEHEINVYIKKSDTDSTLVKSVTGTALTYEWQEVVVVIEETTDSIQIKVEGVCDINDASDSRIWMDDFLVTYYEAPVIVANDASLSSLSVGGTLIDGFDATVASYAMEISLIMDYTVSAESTDPNATVDITQVSNINGTEAERTATIVVTSADQSATTTTTIVFSLNTAVADFRSPEVVFYPNPAKSMLNFQMPENSYQRLEIFNVVGQKVMQRMISSDQKNINVEALQKGIYIMSFTGEAGNYVAKFIKE